MKKYFEIIIFIGLMSSIALSFFNEKQLGAWYLVKKDDTQFVVVRGDRSKEMLVEGEKVRLIRDDSLLNQLTMAPFKIVQLMFFKTPRGTWLVEDESDNRGYVWSTEIKLIKEK